MNTIKNTHDLPTSIQNIRAKLQAMHMTQREFAEKLHASESSVGRLLQGDTALSFDTAVQIAHLLNMSLDEIAGHVTGNAERRDVEAVVNLYERRLEGVRGNHARLLAEVKEAHTQELSSLRDLYNTRHDLHTQHYETRVQDLIRDRKITRIAFAASLVLFFLYLGLDLVLTYLI